MKIKSLILKSALLVSFFLGGSLYSQDKIDEERKALSKDERIEKGRKHIDHHYTILRNDPGRNGRFIIQRNLFIEDPGDDF